MPAGEILRSIYSIAKCIYDQLEQVKALQKQCSRFKERVEIIVAALKGLQDIPETERFIKALRSVEAQLQAGLKLMQRFSHAGKISKFFRAGKYAEKFAEIYTNLDQACSDLNLALCAQQIINREQDRHEQKEDLQALRARQDEIWQLRQEEQRRLEEVKAEVKMLPAEIAEVAKAQYASFRFHMQRHLGDESGEEKAVYKLPPRYSIAYCDLKLHKVIHDGVRCKVYEGKWGAQRAAIKLLKANLGEEEQKLLLREAKLMSRLRGPHFVSLYGVCTEPERTALVMEYMPHGTLKDKLKAAWDLPQKLSCAMDLAVGLQALHQQKIIHGNFTSSSVLFDENDHPKLAAFGLACTTTQSIAPLQIKDTSLWQAPELLKLSAKPTEQADIYSYGVVLWEMFTGQTPHANFTKEAMPASCPAAIAKIIQACWDENPLRRPALEEVGKQLEGLLPVVADVKEDEKKDEDGKVIAAVAAAKEETPKKLQQKIDLVKGGSAEVKVEAKDKKGVVAEVKDEKREVAVKVAAKTEGLYQAGVDCEKEENFKGAAAFYKQAADGGHTKARTNLGMLYLLGRGVPQDKRAAETLLLRSAEEEHARAQSVLATMYANGDGVEKSVPRASFWFHKAAEQGDEKAQKHMQRLGIK